MENYGFRFHNVKLQSQLKKMGTPGDQKLEIESQQ